MAANALAAPEPVLAEAANILRRMERVETVSRIEANGAQADMLGPPQTNIGPGGPDPMSAGLADPGA